MRVVAVYVAAILGVALTGCTDSVTQDNSPTGAVVDPVTQTITATITHTATETITTTMTATPTVTATETVTVTPEAAPAVEDEPASVPSPRPTAPAQPTTPAGTVPRFNVDAAHYCAERILRDISTVDERVMDGGSVPSALGLLASSYGCLADRGAPPGVDAADYLARLATLEDYALQAAASYPVDPLQGVATYDVVRQETAPLLQMLNQAIGSDYTLP